MIFEQRIAAYMSDPRITSLVADRAYPQRAPQDCPLPFITWQRVSTQPQVTHEPVANLELIVIQATCFAATYAGAVALRRAIRSVIEGHHADGPATCENPQDISSEIDTIRAVSADFHVWHDDTDPTP